MNYFNSSIVPVTIQRKDNFYNDEKLAETGKLSSATAIRKVLHGITDTCGQNLSKTLKKECSNTETDCFGKNTEFNILNSYMPESSLNILKEHWNISAPVSSNDFSLLLKYKLLLETRETLVQYLDVTSDLADRIYNNLNAYKTFDSSCNLLKTKELTYTRISRSLLHVLLDIKKTDYELCKKESQKYNPELNTDKNMLTNDASKNYNSYGQ